MQNTLTRSLILLLSSSFIALASALTDPPSHQEAGQGMSGRAHDMAMTAASEASFITQMIPHHQEAVTTSRTLLNLAIRPELRYFAKTIIEVQAREVRMLKGWQAQWYPRTPAAAYTPMMSPLQGLNTGEAERAFLEDMIGHHQGALEMAQSYLEGDFEKHDEVTRLARAIVVAQKGEIARMQAWLGAWFGEREAASPSMDMKPSTPAHTSKRGAH